MKEGTYRLSWEMVKQTALVKYSNADPMFYSNTTQTVPNSEIPDEDWQVVGPVEFTIPGNEHRIDQWKTLTEWSMSDKQFVRNVKLERRVGAPSWIEVES